MTKEEFIDRLNEDLSLEYKSIVQYIQHHATIKGAEFQRMLEELQVHVGQEVTHASVLARQIDFLGGTPTTDVPSIKISDDPLKALQLDLDLERTQLERYRNRVGEAEELGMPDVAEALTPLLSQTQEHVRDLETAIGR